MPVIDAALQNAVEQRPPFLLIAVSILLDQLEHGVLHQVQRIVGTIGRNLCNTVGPALYIRKEPIEFGQPVQFEALRCVLQTCSAGGLFCPSACANCITLQRSTRAEHLGLQGQSMQGV